MADRLRRLRFLGGALTACAVGAANAPAVAGDLSSFERSIFRTRSGTWSWPVYRKGSGPPVLVLHELYGFTPGCVELAARLASRERGGFTVYVPVLFGEAGHPDSPARDLLYNTACSDHVVLSGDFASTSTDRSSKIVGGLAELAAAIVRDRGNPRLGVIGQCLTGNFPLALMSHVPVGAAVLSQPALPFATSAGRKRSLGLSNAEIVTAKQQASKLLIHRFEGDVICPHERYEAYKATFGDAVDGTELPPPHPHAHAVLTDDYQDVPGTATRAAYDRVVAFLKNELA